MERRLPCASGDKGPITTAFGEEADAADGASDADVNIFNDGLDLGFFLAATLPRAPMLTNLNPEPFGGLPFATLAVSTDHRLDACCCKSQICPS